MSASKWKSVKAKWLFSNKSVKNHPNAPPLSASQKYGVIPQATLEENLNSRVMTAMKSLEMFKLVEENDFVISLRSFQGGIEHSNHRGIISPAYTVMTPSELIHPNFFRYVLKEVEFIVRLNSVTIGIRDGKTITYDDFGQLELDVPPIKQQIEISQMLDEKIEQIDKNVQLLEDISLKLEQKRSAFITQAVTKGLNSNVEMKDSGISWLGDIPSHWSLSKVGYLSKIISKGTTPSTLNRELVPQGIKFLKAENIHYDGSVSALPEFYIDEETDNLLKRSRLMSNDILMVIAGATTGKCAILNSDFVPANTNQAVCFIRLKNTRISKFIQTWLSCELIQEQIKQDSVQSAQPNLAMEEIRNFVCPLPPIDEIEHITNRIMEFTDIISNSKSRIEKQINYLIEYRESLISAAVTGKIDVRESV